MNDLDAQGFLEMNIRPAGTPAATGARKGLASGDTRSLRLGFMTSATCWAKTRRPQAPLPIASRHCQSISPAQTAGLRYGMRSVGPDAT
jgi:hypothetical protein